MDFDSPYNEINEIDAFLADSVVVADGKIRRVGSEFTVGRPPALPPGDEQLLPFALNFDGLVFEAPGRYRFVLGIDGRDITTLSFRVNLSAAAGGHR